MKPEAEQSRNSWINKGKASLINAYFIFNPLLIIDYSRFFRFIS